jgi:hypothetical protein
VADAGPEGTTVKDRILVVAAQGVCLMVFAALVLVLVVIADAPRDVAPETHLAQRCGATKDLALATLEAIVHDMDRGVDTSYDEGIFVGTTRTMLILCFPDAPVHLMDLPPHPSLLEYRLLGVLLEDGWAKSTPGQAWRGAIRR